MLIFNDTLGVYGGSQTLLLRMCRWLTEQGISSAILCEDDSNEEIVDKLTEIGVKIFVLDVRNINNVVDILEKLHISRVEIISFYWNHYMDIELVKKKTAVVINNIFYSIHPNSLDKGATFKNAIMRRVAVSLYKSILIRMHNNNAFISMDELNIQTAEQFYKYHFKNRPPIYHLAYQCTELPNVDTLISTSFRTPIIMTAARADFPFKGYLISLLDDFCILKQKFRELQLFIVSGGNDIEILEKKVNEVKKKYNNDVILFPWMDYDVLKEKIKECKVYIGMGTTVLDAAVLYKPAIPVRYNTMENQAEFLFSENINIAAKLDCTAPAIRVLEKVLKSSKSEYERMCRESHQQLMKNYEIDLVMNNFLEHKCLTMDCILPSWFQVVHILNNFKNKMIHRKSKYRYSDVKKVGK